MNHLGERRQANSRCIEGTITGPATYPAIHAGCYPVTCDAEHVFIQVGRKKLVKCPADDTWADTRANVPGYGGFLQCPDPNIICDFSHSCSNNCHFMGDCVKGVCECYPGATGDYCEIPTPVNLVVYLPEVTCQTNEYLDEVEICCLPCHWACATCTGPEEYECESCHYNNFMVDPEVNRCVKDCATGYDAIGGVCT